MTKIVKSSEAPEGEVRVSFGQVSFAVKGNQGYETDDASVIAEAMAHPWLEVKGQESPEKAQDAAIAEQEALNELADVQEAAVEQRATRDPYTEPPAPVPTSIDEMEKLKADGGIK